jgi:hypothetical protein
MREMPDAKRVGPPISSSPGRKKNYFLVYLRGRFSKEDYLMLEEYRSTQPEVAEWFMDKRQGENLSSRRGEYFQGQRESWISYSLGSEMFLFSVREDVYLMQPWFEK